MLPALHTFGLSFRTLFFIMYHYHAHFFFINICFMSPFTRFTVFLVMYPTEIMTQKFFWYQQFKFLINMTGQSLLFKSGKYCYILESILDLMKYSILIDLACNMYDDVDPPFIFNICCCCRCVCHFMNLKTNKQHGLPTRLNASTGSSGISI